MADYNKLHEDGGFKCPGCRDIFWTEEQFEQHLINNLECKGAVNWQLLKEGICPLGVMETV